MTRSGHRNGIRGTDSMEFRFCHAGLLGLDVGGPDNLAPLFSFRGDKLAEIGGRTDKRFTAKVGKPCLDRGFGEDRIDRMVELVDDFSWRAFGSANTQP